MIFKTRVKPGPSTVLKLKQIWTILKSLILFQIRDYLDGQSRRHNIVVAGIKDTGKERLSDLEEKVRKLFTEKLQLDHLKIELDWAHRTVYII